MTLPVIAVIPARLSSKGILRKNMQVVGGMTLLERAIRIARAVCDEVLVTTEAHDETMRALIAQFDQTQLIEVGADEPHIHSDTCTAIEVWEHALIQRKRYHHHVPIPTLSVYLEPTSPCRTTEHVIRAIELLQRKPTLYSVVSGERVPLKYHAGRQFDEEGLPHVEFTTLNETRQQLARTQAFIKNGVVYAVRTHDFLEKRLIFAPLGHTHVMETEPVINIDTREDLAAADMWFKR